VNLISLGCPKNLVDSEMILGNIGAEGLVVTPSADDADVIIVNTCSFIESAKEESIQAILEACELKGSSDHPKKVVVTGCLAQRYGAELRKEVPEVDAIIGLGEYDDIGAALRDLTAPKRNGHRKNVFRLGDPDKACNAEVGRFRLTPAHYAYVKISEGCDNPCTFCSIPSFRGGFRSKPIPMIQDEVRELAEAGAKEIVIISQDTTSYGVDLTGRFELPRLLESIAQVDGVEWIRILYVYPSFVTDEMIDAVASIDKVVKYIDVPLQHISDKMLRRMGRRSNESKTRALLGRMRERIPGLYLRTTFIVGFPGEDAQEFETLRDFVREFKFERLGVFTYSQEDGTPAATFADQVPEKVRTSRLEEIMLIQQENAFRHNRSRRGEIVKVIVEGEHQGAGNAKAKNGDGRTSRSSRPSFVRARSAGEAPEIDPCILIAKSDGGVPGGQRPAELPGTFREVALSPRRVKSSLQVGDFVQARITGSRDYDLLAEWMGEEQIA
jgi:ribosomal protein S12 methylthiotransferase